MGKKLYDEEKKKATGATKVPSCILGLKQDPTAERLFLMFIIPTCYFESFVKIS